MRDAILASPALGEPRPYGNVQTCYATAMTMTVTEARANFRQVIERVKGGEEIPLSQNGEVVAVLIHPKRLSSRIVSSNMIAAQDRLAMLKRFQSQNTLLHVDTAISEDEVNAMVNDVYTERSEAWRSNAADKNNDRVLVKK
jgi:prevent-host-death family protein